MVLLLPFSALVASIMGKITKEMIGVTDKRVKFLNEVRDLYSVKYFNIDCSCFKELEW